MACENVTCSINASILSSDVMPIKPPMSIPDYSIKVMYILMPFIIITNFTIMITIVVTPKLHIAANYFVFSIACCDFFVGSVYTPIMLTIPFSPARGLLLMMFLLVSLNLNCACTYDRYLAVIRSLRYHELMSKRKATQLIIAIILTSVTMACLPLIWFRKPRFHECLVHKIYIGFISSFIVIATISQLTVYIIIFRIARQHAEHIRILRIMRLPQLENRKNSLQVGLRTLLSNMRMVKSFMLVMLTYFLFWLPVAYINLADDVFGKPHLVPYWLMQLSFYTLWISCIVHPVLYGFFQKSLRRSIFPCCGVED